MSAPMPWFRLYHRIVDDTKLKLLAFEDRWHFVAVCCLKSSGLIDKPDTDLRTREIAVALGVQLRELDEISRRLREVGLVDEYLNPLAWDELQFKSDNSTARVQAYRERQQNQGGNGTKRSRNVTVTAQETDTDTEEVTPNGVCASGDARFTASDFVESWNETADQCGLPRIAKLTDRRKRAFAVRQREYPDIEDWRKAFRCLRDSPWMHGDNKTGWRADPDFFLQPKSFTKLVEGSYGQAH
jgi:hypothetical protein